MEKSVIREMERALDLTRRLQSLIELGNYGEPLKESAKLLSEEVLQSCNTTLSAFKSHHGQMSCKFARTKKRRLQGSAAQARGRDLRSKSSVRKQVTAAPYDDGHQWRKYGEKVIKGCLSTRSYYRCTFSDEKRCQARKQVQQVPNDPALFLVIYRGDHTCSSNNAARLIGSPFQTASSNLASSPGSPQPQDHAPFQLLCLDTKCHDPEKLLMTTDKKEHEFMGISSRMNIAMFSDENQSSTTTSSCKLESGADFSTFVDQSEETLLLRGTSSPETSGIIEEDDDALVRELLCPCSIGERDFWEFDFDGILDDFAASIGR